MSGGIESMHEDARGASPRPGSGKARDLAGLFMYYEAACAESDKDEQARMTLELCHSIMIELANHVYDLHGQRT